MGLRFDYQWANWIAYLTVPGKAPPPFEDQFSQSMAIDNLLQQLEEGFFSGAPFQEHWLADIRKVRDRLREGSPASEANLEPLRRFLSNRSWFALIVPRGGDYRMNRSLSDAGLLRQLVRIRPDDPGLILQIKDPPQGRIDLKDAFPAFRAALANAVMWPGLLVWDRTPTSVFLPFDTDGEGRLLENLHWVFEHLAVAARPDLQELRRRYEMTFPNAMTRGRRAIHLLHVSDIHIGCKEARTRLPRLQDIIHNVIDDLGSSKHVVPVVSGDIVNTPKEKYVDQVRVFLSFLKQLRTVPPVVVLGNHDVRRKGIVGTKFKETFGLSTTNVVWIDDMDVGILPFNSVTNGDLAQGSIGETQFTDIARDIELKPEWKRFALFAVVHHHPMTVPRPVWYRPSRFERMFRGLEERTMTLRDASAFIAFVEQRKVAAVLHGHRHIPHIAETPSAKIPVFGCGSSVGKVDTNDGKPYMSLNVITYEPGTKKVFARLLAERSVGAGLNEMDTDESIWVGH